MLNFIKKLFGFKQIEEVTTEVVVIEEKVKVVAKTVN